MKQSLISGVAVLAMAVCAFVSATSQDSEVIKASATTAPDRLVKTPGSVVVPASSVRPITNGTTPKTRLASTNLLIYVPEGWNPSKVSPPNPAEVPPYGGYAYETPASLGCVYDLVTVAASCNPNTVVNNPSGGSNSIAIVDAYDDPEAEADLAYFSAQFGLPFSPGKFQVVYQSGYAPPVDYTGSWELEESLDIEYAHAMAPDATIYLVEANSNSFSDLFTSVTIAANLVHCKSTATCPAGSTGKGEVSMSWGGGEFSGETGYDTYFTTADVVYLAAAGDSPGVIYPSASPNVISVGGTSIRRSAVNGNFIAESSWPDGGSGSSSYESRPSYQAGVAGIVGTTRGTPDVSADANPYTGVWVYDSFPNDYSFSSVGWWIVGGTSLSTPVWAGVINRAGSFAASSPAELSTLYSHLGVAGDFHDVVGGQCYYYAGLLAVAGYDECTGIGSPHSYAGK